MDQTAPSVPATVPDAPRVFATCLYHYNCGDLVGNWFDAQGAEEVTLADVHRGQAPVTPECEEIAVFDADCMAVNHEMDLVEAGKWGALYAEVGPDQWLAFCAWVGVRGITDADDVVTSAFYDAYAGEWGSWRDYVESLADELSVFDALPADLRSYIDMDRYGRDLAHGYTVEDRPCGGIFVFHDC